MADAKYRQTTWNGITVDYIEADMSTIQIEDLGGKNLTARYSPWGTFRFEYKYDRGS